MQKVATSTEAGRNVVMHGDDPRLAENASAKLARKRQEAQIAADALNTGRVDTTTPLVGRAPMEQLPDPPAPADPPAEPAKPARSITLATMITYRDYEITITATGLNLDQFCDMLDRRLGVAE